MYEMNSPSTYVPLEDSKLVLEADEPGDKSKVYLAAPTSLATTA